MPHLDIALRYNVVVIFYSPFTNLIFMQICYLCILAFEQQYNCVILSLHIY
jgi:hypothetical protein